MPLQHRRPTRGCGLGCLTRVTATLLATSVVLLAAHWVFHPWAFYLGGHLHMMPLWQGRATLHARSGDYVLDIWMSPARPSRGTIGPRLPSLDGGGSLCTPRGERIPLRFYGVILESIDRDSSGKPMRIQLYRRPWYWSLAGTWDRRPRFDMRGRWENGDLVMNDGGAVSAQFLADGRLYDGPPGRQPKPAETLPVIFHEVPWTWSTASCAAAR